MRVLIGTDGSDDAIHAATRGLAIITTPDIVTVVCVVEPPAIETAGLESGFSGGMASPAEITAVTNAANDHAQDALNRTVAALSTTATVEQRIDQGDAGQMMCFLAEDLAADAIVVGSRGRGRIRRALMGSVSSHIIHNAPCPVVVVRLTD
jgi:nucleotide-binding universal stress UspA family protein